MQTRCVALSTVLTPHRQLPSALGKHSDHSLEVQTVQGELHTPQVELHTLAHREPQEDICPRHCFLQCAQRGVDCHLA
jgi:hypothetical protein